MRRLKVNFTLLTSYRVRLDYTSVNTIQLNGIQAGVTAGTQMIPMRIKSPFIMISVFIFSKVSKVCYRCGGIIPIVPAASAA
jgi:hypothetical protein